MYTNDNGAAPLQCHSTIWMLSYKLSVMYSVFLSKTPKQQFVKFTPGVSKIFLAFDVPSALNTKTTPKLG